MTRRLLRLAVPLLAALTGSVVFAVASSAAGGTVTIDAGPSGPTSAKTPEFRFSGPAGTSTFDCRLDSSRDADWTPCSSPWTPPAPLADGGHVFEVRGHAAGGDPAPAFRTFTVDSDPPPLSVTGPDPVVHDTTATVSFDSTDPGAAFACAVDSDDYKPCTSPFATPDLPNGEHSVNVRAADAAGNTTVATRLFEIDVDPPETTIEAGPDGTTRDNTPDFHLASDRPRTKFECALDHGDWQKCPASYTTPELQPGAHSLEARAVDGAGNRDASPAHSEFTVAACEPEVRIGVLVARSECFVRDGDVFTTDDPVKVNGITFNPQKGKPLSFDTAQRTIKLRGIQLRLGSIVLFNGDLQWQVPDGDRVTLARINLSTFQRTDTTAGDREGGLDLQGDDDANFAGFDLKGEATLDLVPNGAELKAHIELPKVFADAEGRGLTGDITIAADADRGVRLSSAGVVAPQAFIGDLAVRNLFLRFTGENGGAANATCNAESPGLRWDGGAESLTVPFEEPLVIQNAGFGFADGGFSYARGEWNPGDPGRHIGGGVRIQRIALSLCAGKPWRLEGRTALTAVPDAEGKPRLSIPEAAVIVTGSDPWTARVEAPKATFTGDRPFELTNTFVQLTGDGAIDFGSHLRFGLGLKGSIPGAGDLDAAVNVDADAQGFVDGPLFNASLSAQGCFDGRFNVLGAVPVDFKGFCANADGVVSSKGAAFCAGVKVDGRDLGRIGAGANWGEPVQFIARSCDVGPWTVQKPQPAPPAEGARAGAGVRAARVDVPRSRRGAVIALRGSDGPPQVVLHGPHGARVPTPESAGQVVKTRRSFAFQNVVTKTTYVVVAGGGRWSAQPVGGDAVTDVRTARMLPRPSVKAGVRGRGRTRTLSWKVRPRPGQRVVFVERGRRVARVIGVARGARGKMRFTSADGPRGRRTVDAIVEQDGRPRARIAAAAYGAPGPVRAGRPRAVSVLRGRSDVRVTWARAIRARRYGVRVELSDGRKLFYLRDARDRYLTLPGVARGRDVRVRVVGLRADNRPGPAATARSKGATR
jgi:hypothetical protein